MRYGSQVDCTAFFLHTVLMVTGKYLVVDARGFIPFYHLVDSVKEVRAVLGAAPDPVKQLVFRVNEGGGMVKVEPDEDPSYKVYSIWEEDAQ